MNQKLILILLIIGVFLVGCSESSSNDPTLITGSAVAVQDAPKTKATTVKLDCENKQELIDKITKKQATLQEVNAEIEQLSLELELYLRAGDYKSIKLIQFETEKALKIKKNEEKNLDAIQGLLSKCK